MITSIVQLDIAISLFFRGLVTTEDVLAPYVSFFSDFAVFAVAIFLVILWLFAVAKKEVGYKIIALDILYAILFAFVVYWILQF